MSFERWILNVMSGQTRGVGAAAARAALAMAEPAYAGAAARRNRRFDTGQREILRLTRPVISVGNLTTGGTGKTPAVQWLVRKLQARGHRPGVLLRGYRKSAANIASDEEALLRETLRVPVVANPDRFRGGTALLAASPEVDVLVLDDGFQHRRLARDFDIVLIDATNPFGFDHVLPRGLLREPVAGIARADLILITRSNQADASTLTAIETRIREHHASARIVQTTHAPDAFCIDDKRLPIDALRGSRVFAISGIGNPAAFERSLAEVGMEVVGRTRYGDHHAYRDIDVTHAIAAMQAAGATHLMTTEKDWIKLSPLIERAKISAPRLPSPLRLAIELQMSSGDEHDVLARIASRLSQRS
jgi:tetraacyldisaccharide 4'-kinase